MNEANEARRSHRPLALGTVRGNDRGADCVIFPTPRQLLVPIPLRNATCCALVRLPDKRILFLRATGVAWTVARIDAVSRVCGADKPLAEIGRHVGRSLGIASLTASDCPFDSAGLEEWDVRKIADAMYKRMRLLDRRRVNSIRPGDLAAAHAQRLTADLRESIDAFVVAMDTEVRPLAMRDGRLDLELYNFLVREPYRDWRMQLAHAFPILVRAAATGDAGTPGAQIRAAVDAGLPLVRHLAGHWGVSPGALRCLRDRPVVIIGAHWEHAPDALVRILDSMCPEDRPTNDVAHWRRLGCAVSQAEELFRRPVASSPLALAWLRSQARHAFRRVDTLGSLRRLADAVPLFNVFREALVHVLSEEAESAFAAMKANLHPLIARAADRFLAAMQPRELVSLATTYALEHKRRAAAVQREHKRLEEELRRLQREVFWPLLPRPFVTAEGSRIAVPLASRDDIADESSWQKLCLREGSRYLDATAERCAAGNDFLLSIRDADSGTPLSTVELRARHSSWRDGTFALSVVQHRAFANAAPSVGCVEALRQTLAWIGSQEVQDHLQAGRRQNWRSLPDARVDNDEEGRRIMGGALRATLGESRIDDLAEELRLRAAECLGDAPARDCGLPEIRSACRR